MEIPIPDGQKVNPMQRSMKKVLSGNIVVCLSLWLTSFAIPTQAQSLSGTGDGEDVLYTEAERRLDSLFIEATGQYLSDQKENAFNTYLQVIEENPESSTAYFQLANILAEKKKFSEALVYAEKAAQLDTGNTWFLLLQAQLLKTTRLYPKAADAFAKLYRMNPHMLDYAYERSNMYILSGDITAAISVYDELESTYGINEGWSMQKYKLYNASQNSRMARKVIEDLHAEFPDNTQYMEILAQIHMNAKEYKKAYSYLKKVLDIKPDDPYTYLSLVDYYRSIGNTQNALEALEKAISNPSLDYNTKNNVVMTYFKEEDAKKFKGKKGITLGHYLDLLRKSHPQEGEAQFNYAKFLVMEKHYAEAIPVLKQAIEVAPDQSGSWNMILLAAYQLDDTSTMRIYSEDALKRFPEQSFPYMFAAIAAYVEKDYDKAVSLANSGIRISTIHDVFMETMMLQILADSYFELGKLEESVKMYQRIFKINPDDVYVKNNYAYFLTLLGKDLELARTLSEDICREQPENMTFLDTYGWVLYHMGEYEKASEIIGKALQYGGSHEADILEHYGDVMLKLGDPKTAMEYWIKALKKKIEKDPELQEKINRQKNTER